MQTKTKQKKTSGVKSQKHKKDLPFPLDKQNLIIIGIGIIFLIIGYIFMAQNSVDGFLPTVVAPILLVLGYCVIIPYGILKKAKVQKSDTVETQGTSETSDTKQSQVNVKTA